MDFLHNINTIVSLLAGLIAIGIAIASVLSKRRTVQRAIENPSMPVEIRLQLEDKWSGAALYSKVISGIIKSELITVFSTILVIFMINFFLAIREFLHDLDTFSRAPNYSQAQDVFSHMLSGRGQIFMFSNLLSFTIGIIIGLLLGILAGLATGNRHMPGRIYSLYAPLYRSPNC